jgi:hypothetical protein
MYGLVQFLRERERERERETYIRSFIFAHARNVKKIFRKKIKAATCFLQGRLLCLQLTGWNILAGGAERIVAGRAWSGNHSPDADSRSALPFAMSNFTSRAVTDTASPANGRSTGRNDAAGWRLMLTPAFFIVGAAGINNIASFNAGMDCLSLFIRGERHIYSYTSPALQGKAFSSPFGEATGNIDDKRRNPKSRERVGKLNL